jgi:hypothetical protein
VIEDVLRSEDTFETRDVAAQAPAHESDRRSHDDVEDADDDEAGDDEPREGKAASRDIPTWKEVIGLIIAGNMESRSRSPKSALSRPRLGEPRPWPRPRFRQSAPRVE